MKEFADNKLNVAVMMISLFDRVENTVGKGENAGYRHFLLYPHCFLKRPSLGLLKVGTVWLRDNVDGLENDLYVKKLTANQGS